MTTELGIIGWPVSHSKSPAMHAAAAKALGLDVRYETHAVKPDALKTWVRAVRGSPLHGFNVTVPHKEHILPLLDEVDTLARSIGAVNTVLHRDGRLLGYNTDARGLVLSLLDAEIQLRGACVTILGAGGAARAAAVGVLDAGATEVHIAARRIEQAQLLCSQLASHAATDAEMTAVRFHDLHRVLAHTDLLVQATNATLEGNPGAQAFARALPLDQLPAQAAVVDLVYQPRDTALLLEADALNLQTVDGLGMLVHQGALAFQIWMGVSPPIDVMRAALD